MNITVHFFAGLRERVGHSEITKEVHEGLTVDDLWGILTEEFPSVRPFTGCILFAVNQVYAKGSHRLERNDEVALIPPVSGGVER